MIQTFIVLYIIAAILYFCTLNTVIISEFDPHNPEDKEVEDIVLVNYKRYMLLIPVALLWPIHFLYTTFKNKKEEN